MTAALQGSVEGVGLTALLRFLAGIEKSGRLRVFDGEWSGELGLDSGHLVSAFFGHEQGLPAAEAMALVFRRGRFTFEDGRAPGERNLELPPEKLAACLQAAERFEVGPVDGRSILDAVPEVVDSPPGAGGVSEIVLDRTELRTLLAVDGQASVAALSRGDSLALTIRHLAALAELGLVRFSAVPERSTPAQTNRYRRQESSDPTGVAPSEAQVEPAIALHAAAAAPSDVDEPRAESPVTSRARQNPSEAAGTPRTPIGPLAGRRRFWRIPWLVTGTSILLLGLVLGNTLVTAVPRPDWNTSNSRAQPTEAATAAPTAAPSETPPPTAAASPTVTAGPTAPRTFQISLNGRLTNTRSQ